MAMLDDLLELFGDEVTLEPYVSQDQMGLAVFGSGVSRAAHIEGSSVLVRDPSGQERVSRVQVYLPGAYDTSELDRITLPAPWNPTQPPIISVERESDEAGSHHEVVYC